MSTSDWLGGRTVPPVIKGGRWYAMPGEAGLLITTWPKGGAELARGTGRVFDIGVGYFNECMNGFEYQVASHMIWESDPGSELARKGLAIARTIHDRYAPVKRNPYNEIECSDHYSRSMAAYGVFLAACGYEYHGPKGHIGFAPRFSPDKFKAPFTAAEGWGTFEQTRTEKRLEATLRVRWGRLRLNSIALHGPAGLRPSNVTVRQKGQLIRSTFQVEGDKCVIQLIKPLVLAAESDNVLQVEAS
jgi:hypothetical protein